MTSSTAAKPSQEGRKHFLNLTAGKLSGLRQITDDKNRFRVLALDQSNSFKKALRALHEKAGKPAEPTHDEILGVKLEMVKALSSHSSAVLLDVMFGARQAVATFSLPKSVGLIVRSEASKDAGIPSEYEPGWSVEKIKRMGAAAVKLLVYLDTEDKDNVKAQLSFVERVAKDCRDNDILLMTEELSFPRKGEEKTSPSYVSRKVKNILEATRLIGPHTDILKLEFPGFIKTDSAAQMEENLGRLNEAAIRPWVLLSAGEKFDLFVKQVELAMKAGCSGYMAGRAIFNEYFEQAGGAEARAKFLATTGVERMKALNKVIAAHALPWTERCGLTPADLGQAVRPDWYLGKGEKAASGGAVKGDY
jgi:tagatose 1,6-diphosphate aldolase